VLCLVMDLCDQGDILDYALRHSSYTEVEASRLMLQVHRVFNSIAPVLPWLSSSVPVTRCLPKVMSALSYLHSQACVHRDVRPESIMMVRASDSSCHCKLARFHASSFHGATCDPGFRVPAPYLGPEALNNTVFPPSLDLYSVGCLLYVLLVGAFPTHPDALVTSAGLLHGEILLPQALWGNVSEEVCTTRFVHHLLDCF
jgi:serine/threonine protein kinase